MRATPKANTLPPDLRKHWEDAMADKFPMSQDEAIAYIQHRYNSSFVTGINKWDDGSLELNLKIVEGMNIYGNDK
jgi:hypothetical protein